MVFPIVAPSWPREQWCEQFCIYIISESFHVNMINLAQWFGRRFLNYPTPFLHFCDYLHFEEDLALYLNNVEFPLPKEALYQVWLKLVCWFWRRKLFFNINICKYGIPYCGPTRPTGTMLWTILHLHYIRKLSYKYDLFWLGSSGEDF
jgi:hypothetical protein